MTAKKTEDSMAKLNLIYERFVMNFYKSIFKNTSNEDSRLTALEAITLDIINAMERPTVNCVAKFLETSQPNAAYRIGSLEDKGYIEKVQSTEDRREYFLVLTDKYHDYAEDRKERIQAVYERFIESYNEDEIAIIEKILDDFYQAQIPMIEELKA